MAIVSSQDTRARRGAGGDSAASAAGVAYNGAKQVHLDWTSLDNETITPGSGGVPFGVLNLAWTSDNDNEECSVSFDHSTRLGKISSTGGFITGILHVWYRS